MNERRTSLAARAGRRRYPHYFEMDSPTLFMVGAAILALTCLLYLVQSSRVTMLGYQV
ncbi:MAG: hypothetical protein WKH64_03260 [Chloroflexia bacterium]